MFLFDIFSLFFSAQAGCTSELCPAAAFDPITAALATQGYYAQADLLYYLNETGMGKLAGLIYAISAFAGIISMVLGAPPRNYVWFFMGPAIYHWLVATPLPVLGMRWMDVPGKAQTFQTSEENQKEVWRIAKPGLANNAYVLRNGITITSDSAPSKPAQVSLFFLWVDSLFSGLIEQFIPVTGVYNQVQLSAAANGVGGKAGGLAGGGFGKAATEMKAGPKNWSILTDLKWSKLEDITSAKLRNGDLRDAFVTFLASECGDGFAEMIDDAKWIAATTGSGANIPVTVFKNSFPGSDNYGGGAFSLYKHLAKKSVPMPESLQNMLRSGMNSLDKATFLDSAKNDLAPYVSEEATKGGIPCNQYLRIVVHGFKFEAAHMYSQLIDGGPGEFGDDPAAIRYNLLYGWGIEGLQGNGNDQQKYEDYIMNLILVYLFRNEFTIAPKPVDVRYSASREAENYVDAQISTVGSKTKYAEVYSWAKMVPYFQGIMLYVLAMAYPFAALMVIIPGWHKTVITWMTFWIWLRSWDLGIAVVKTLERSIWAMMGNSTTSEIVNFKILEMAKWMPLAQGNACAEGGAAFGDCLIPDVKFEGQWMDTNENTFKLLGRAMSLAGNLDLDLTNSYYIYIMAALYFAVPGVTGQIILGAKAGSANLIGGMIQGMGDKASGAAASGFQGDKAAQLNANAASIGQASYGKAMRQSGLAHAALDQGNQAMEAGLNAQSASTMSSVWGGVGQARERKNASEASNYGTITAAANPLLQKWSYNQAQKSRDNASSEAPGGAGSAPGPAGAGSTNNASSGKKQNFAHDYGVPTLASAPEFAKNKGQQDNLAFQQAVGEGQNRRAVDGFVAGSAQSRAQAHGQRLGGYGNFVGESAAAKASVDYANQIGGMASVIAGTPPGSLVRPKPMMNQDAAMGGGLGAGAQAAANYASSGGAMQTSINGHAAALRGVSAQTSKVWGGGSTLGEALSAVAHNGITDQIKGAVGTIQSLPVLEADSFDNSQAKSIQNNAK